MLKRKKQPGQTDGNVFRCLCVKSPYAGQIVDGTKTEVSIHSRA